MTRGLRFEIRYKAKLWLYLSWPKLSRLANRLISHLVNFIAQNTLRWLVRYSLSG